MYSPYFILCKKNFKEMLPVVLAAATAWVSELLQALDKNNDGFISRAEFSKLIKNLPKDQVGLQWESDQPTQAWPTLLYDNTC